MLVQRRLSQLHLMIQFTFNLSEKITEMSVPSSESNSGGMFGGEINFSDGINTNKEKAIVGVLAGGLMYLWMRKRLKKAYGKAIQKGRRMGGTMRRRYSTYRRRYSRR